MYEPRVCLTDDLKTEQKSQRLDPAFALESHIFTPCLITSSFNRIQCYLVILSLVSSFSSNLASSRYFKLGLLLSDIEPFNRRWIIFLMRLRRSFTDSENSELKREEPRKADMPESPDVMRYDTPTLAETLPPWRRPSETPPISSARSASATVLDAFNVSEIPRWVGEKSDVSCGDVSAPASGGESPQRLLSSDATNSDVDIVLTAPSPRIGRRSQKSESDKTPVAPASKVDASGDAHNTDECVIPPPWRHNDSPVQKDFHREPPDDDMVTQAEDDDDTPTKASPPSSHRHSPPRNVSVPWRSLGSKSDIKRPIALTSTPAWRQLSSDTSVVR